MKTKDYTLLTLLFVTSLFITKFVHGQDLNGLIFSEYSGISGGMINPALLTGSKVYMDVNIIGGSVAASNNMAYFQPENKTLSKIFKMDTLNFNDGDFKYDRTYNYYDNKDDKYLNTNIKVLGPSAMVQYGHHAFGLNTSFRSVHSTNNVPYEMPIIAYEGLGFEEYRGVEFDEYNYSMVSMTWSELSLSYAYDLINYYDNKFTAGITVKGLFGHEGAYVAMEHANYTIQDSRSIDFHDVDAEIGLSIPFNDKTYSVDMEPLIRGYGVGFDIGFVFTKKESIYDHQGYNSLCSRPFQDYIYRIGLSILDLGSISFNKDTELYKFKDANANWVDFDTTHFTGFGETLEKYSQALYGDGDQVYAGDKMKIGLPTVVSLQFDAKLKDKFYLSALWKQPIRFNLHTLWTPAQIAVTPRYETRYWGVSMPVSLYNYKEPRVGLAVRLYTITVGTEWLTSLMGVSKFRGMDVYCSIKFNLVKGQCGFNNMEW